MTLRPVLTTGVLAVWLVGVGIFSLRLLGGWIQVRRLARRTLRPAGPDIQALARRVAGRLALDRIVGIFESAAVSVPVMVGWIKPTVLLPAAALTGLSTVQLEALLAHELAHVRRHDYLVNLLQGLVETLLFYHPAVWWVSRQVRREREHCCDDLAVGVCDRLVYATALADLASLTVPRSFALAATDGSLLDRVRRILGHKNDERPSTSPWLPVSFIGLLAVAVVPMAFVSAQSQDARPQLQEARPARVETAAPVAVVAEKTIAPVEDVIA
jgi:beta-lactamase regulating signal transducer with metallopeptidase domain